MARSAGGWSAGWHRNPATRQFSTSRRESFHELFAVGAVLLDRAGQNRTIPTMECIWLIAARSRTAARDRKTTQPKGICNINGSRTTYCPFGTCLSFHDQIIGSRIRCQTTICFLIKIGAFIIESFPLINIERSHRITGLHNLQRTSQIAIVSSEYKVISCEVCYFILHIRSIQTGFPCSRRPSQGK